MSKLILAITLLSLMSCGTTSNYQTRTQKEARAQQPRDRSNL